MASLVSFHQISSNLIHHSSPIISHFSVVGERQTRDNALAELCVFLGLSTHHRVTSTKPAKSTSKPTHPPPQREIQRGHDSNEEIESEEIAHETVEEEEEEEKERVSGRSGRKEVEEDEGGAEEEEDASRKEDLAVSVFKETKLVKVNPLDG